MDGKLVNTELVQLVKLIMLLTCRERERERERERAANII